ncbi:MAG: FG-GAP-like repeat-containing protein, partial [Bacteroidota bacterium]
IDFDNDGDLDIMIENHNFGIDIYENNLIPSSSFSLSHATPGTSTILGLDQSAIDGDYASVTDFDNDGYIDVIARKRSMEDFWRNNGDGTFTAVNWVDQEAHNDNKGAVSLYDFDNDGDYDLVWTDNDVNQIWQQTGVGTGNFVASAEPSTSAGITLPISGIDGLACGDVDNDGDIDLFLGNNSDSSYLFINTTPIGSATLSFIRNNCHINPNANVEGAAFVDFDQDGDLDLYLNISGGNNQLWLNNLSGTSQDNHLFIRVYENLNNGIPNRDAIGANIVLKDCNGNVISGIREVNGGNGHGTQDPAFVHFGLPSGSNNLYIVDVAYPYLNGSRKTAQFKVTPSTLGAYHLLEIDPQSILDNPTANDDSGGTLYLNTSQSYAVLDNDLDAGGDDFFIAGIISAPTSGTASIVNSNTEIQYVADGNTGTIAITYQICETSCQYLCDTAILSLTVIPEYDYGDAPNTYGDICYTINPVNSPFAPTRLGSSVDSDPAMQNDSNANGDDADGNDDDDGVSFIGGTILTRGTNPSLSFSWSSNDTEGHIFAWIDFNGDGDFDDPSERIIDNFLVGSDGHTNGSSGSTTVSFTIPTDAACGVSYARFTIQDNINEQGPTGTFCSSNDGNQDGEVEDYVVSIVGCPEICNNNFDDDGDGLIDCSDLDCCCPQAPSLAK